MRDYFAEKIHERVLPFVGLERGERAQELRQCIAGKPKPNPKCTLENTVLGLCTDK
jgi:hypothetical protein